jgi:predicted RNA binding protein YcfA (HicA-like mRNA interferase family)
MRIKITYRELVKRLKEIHFIEKSKIGFHLMLINQDYNITIVLPLAKITETVPEYLLKTIRKSIVEKGVMNEDDFYNLMSRKK